MAQKKPTQSKPKQNTRKTGPEPRRSWSDTALNIWLRFERFAWDVGGVLLLALSVMTLLALLLPELAGGVLLIWWAAFLRHWFGWGSLFIVIVSGALGLAMLRRRVDSLPTVRWGRVFALEAAAFAALTLMTLSGGSSLERAEVGLDGGRVGWGLAELVGMILPSILVILVLGFLLVVCLIAGLGLVEWLSALTRKFLGAETDSGAEAVAESAVSVAPAQGGQPRASPAGDASKKRTHVAPEFRKQFRIKPKDERPASSPPRDERLPPLNLLVSERSVSPDERHVNQRAGMIEQTLAEFGIPAKVIGFQVGPTVTQFAVEPGFIERTGVSSDEMARLRKVRVSQISGLARDMALALSAERLRVQAPVPGRAYVGIEVPNSSSAIVRLRPILETEAFYKVGSPLTLALGRDVSGHPVVADLAAMPHLLIAGTTGSGKSVCIAAFTTCLAMSNTPEDLRLVMIDPKMVELVRFNGLPHLYGKVETSLERILVVLRWVVAEMDRRYILLEHSRSRNIDTYNRKMHRRKDGQTLPRIVVMIDELADLMMSAPDATEHTLVRLAQMARATGIHLIVATQRPSTDVVTGLIKANFPARMSFAVASSVDSRVILDTSGAEHLLGRGDMLFLPPEAGSPIRIQGTWVTDQEVERAITFWHKYYPQDEAESPPWDEMLEQETVLADRDDLVEKAIALVIRTQRASASMLQRQLRIGYPRAARLMDELEELGIVGSARGGGRERDVLVDAEEEDVER
ncbi:MAG: DNA translocase FtsK [Chloroflexi bacterium]|nr:DNA translocase FtsK [Chloroflexota bacterium]